MIPDRFGHLLSLVQPKIEKKDTHYIFSNKFYASSQFLIKSNDLTTSVQAFFSASLSLNPFLDLSYSTGKVWTVSDNFWHSFAIASYIAILCFFQVLIMSFSCSNQSNNSNKWEFRRKKSTTTCWSINFCECYIPQHFRTLNAKIKKSWSDS